MRAFRKQVFEDVLYAQCWEDPAVDRIALEISPADTVFSITSGGCNVLAFLLDNPRKVIALDINPYQNYLLDLKMAAFRTLGYEDLLGFLGVRECFKRMELYERVRSELRKCSKIYWDTQADKIKQGIIHCGRYEKYMALLRTAVTRLMGFQLIQKFFVTEDTLTRAELFQKEWENRRWQLITRILLSRRMMSLLFDKRFFTYVDGDFSFGDHFSGRVRKALVDLPPQHNPFLSYILRGKFDEGALPLYLRAENYPIIRSRLDRITLVFDSCERYFAGLPDSCISKFNFTNIFEWMGEEAFERLLRETCRIGRDGSILTYRNLLVPRERPPRLATRLQPLRSIARRLHARDLSFIYNTYVVERVTKGEHQWATPCERWTAEEI